MIIIGFQTDLMETESANLIQKSHILKHTNKIRVRAKLNRNHQLKTDLWKKQVPESNH